VNIVMGVLLFHVIGFQGIAMATSIAAWINVLQMVTTLAKRGTYSPSAKTWNRLIRIGLSTFVFGLLLFGASHWRHLIESLFDHVRIGHVIGAKEFAILLTCVVGAFAYPPLLFASGGVTLAEIKRALKRKPASIEEEIGETPAGPGLL
jgi:putative peptidoglycan lipid II flippase